MKEIKFSQVSPMGKIEGILRIIGKDLFFKYNNNQYAEQAMKQMENKGAIIIRKREWIKVNLFNNQENVIMGGKEFNVNETLIEDIEMILFNFYMEQFKKAGCEVKEG
ncbi:MAG TPA: hypothetical protein ENG87_04000 [Candidatus Pacearchaeota archaeon]|nr:hypothetical protein [Candidatus Pacearchaeota archaeon]HDZ61194.1 hypothetical protein [Candidatus Pacearchaeota archaeon]